ncbi:Zinc finger HIT domain-containing protein 2 [Coemansia sp. RSA 988]|nr:Zinc finger HIT domain-containing protein 2 [Coemansia sp. RSA 988]
MKHDGCSESFYKDQIDENMKVQQADEETKKEMQRIVQRYHDQINLGEDMIDVLESDDGNLDDRDKYSSLVERLEGIDLEDNVNQGIARDIWNRLTNEEREDFMNLIGGRDIEAIITPWKPWWYSDSSEAGIVEVDRESNSNPGSATVSNKVPPITESGAPVQKLAYKVHPSVLFQLAQIR